MIREKSYAEIRLWADWRLRKLYGALTSMAATENNVEVSARCRKGAWISYRLSKGQLVYGHRQLADITGMNASTVRRKLLELQSLGLVSYIKQESYYPSIVEVKRSSPVPSGENIGKMTNNDTNL